MKCSRGFCKPGLLETIGPESSASGSMCSGTPAGWRGAGGGCEGYKSKLRECLKFCF